MDIAQQARITPSEFMTPESASEIRIALVRRAANMLVSYEQSKVEPLLQCANDAAIAYLEFTGESMDWRRLDLWMSMEGIY